MVTLPRDSVILYATLVISFWISSEWYFLPMTALRPVTVFLMLEVICHQASAAEEGALRSSGRVLRAHPAQCGLAVLPLLVGEAHHAPGWSWAQGGAMASQAQEAAAQLGSGAQQLTQWSAWTPRLPARRCRRDAQWPRLPRGRGAIRHASAAARGSQVT